MYIPYTWLTTRPQSIPLCGVVPVSFRLSEPGGMHCIISLTDSHTFPLGRSVSVQVGTDFELEYKGVINEIQLGRRFVVRDA